MWPECKARLEKEIRDLCIKTESMVSLTASDSGHSVVWNKIYGYLSRFITIHIS